jgi:hypothetical protein
MPDVEVKNFDSPDETRPFEGKGQPGRAPGLAGRVRARLEVVDQPQAHRGDGLVPGIPSRLLRLGTDEDLHG